MKENNINYEEFLNIGALINDSQRNTETLLELYFRLTNNISTTKPSEAEIKNTLRFVESNLMAMEVAIAEKLNNLK